MSLLADTSVVIAPPAQAAGDDQRVAISVVTLGELHAGVELARDDTVRSARLARLAAIAARIPVLAADAAVAARYGELRRASARIGSNDLWIAATALTHGLTLVTRDERQAALPLVDVRHVG